VERLIAAMEGEGILPPSRSKLDVYIITLGDEERIKGFELASLLRREGLQIEMGHGEKSLKAEMRKADKVQAQFIFILGQEELKKGLVMIKSMADGTQEGVAPGEALSYIRERLKRP
jgi:histidyl-tRNA synthetase